MWLKRLFYLLCLTVRAAAIILVLEGASRVVHWNARPMIPYILDRNGVSRMAPDLDISVRLPGHNRFRIITDALGCRVAGSEVISTDRGGGVLVIGDSQVLGWGLNFEDTLAAELGREYAGLAERAITIAAAATDPESLIAWVRDYAQRHPGRLRLSVIAVNLGNDFDELYFSRGVVTVPTWHGLTDWLTAHSFLFLDIALLKAVFFGENWAVPPGTNPVVFTLDQRERRALAIAAAKAVRRLANTLPPADQVVVLILPNDLQVSLSEFDKYRDAYSDLNIYQTWRSRTQETVRRLDDLVRVFVKALDDHGLRAIQVRDDLATHDPVTLFDRHSHHLTAYGQSVAAQATVNRLETR